MSLDVKNQIVKVRFYQTSIKAHNTIRSVRHSPQGCSCKFIIFIHTSISVSVGCDCHRTNNRHKIKLKSHFKCHINGAIAIAPYRASPLFPNSNLGMYIGVKKKGTEKGDRAEREKGDRKKGTGYFKPLNQVSLSVLKQTTSHIQSPLPSAIALAQVVLVC